ncbi:hypothetical protein FOA43_001443 [Brettanomyces nanus]|uniref:Uncharacterized protein n=1 Tax=Eeniella nana TaxID=13502 RepID=A0A875RXD9_EENNA|nr:uncharacterized protein FOA43_001443 [Brettanomyces nanus]QPG74121.1 hypothetical protein FOA43_001443 [Brettanomyces nanus]
MLNIHDALPKNGAESDPESASASVSGSSRRQESILSPHNSIFKALHNPELDFEVSPTTAIPEFSVSSWQPVSRLSPDPIRQQQRPFEGVDSSFVLLSESPNVGSVLSSSSDLDDRSIDDHISSRVTTLHSQRLTATSSLAVLRPDEDCESLDMSETDSSSLSFESSTIIPSFVMPRVSIPSLDVTTNSDSLSVMPLNIQVIGQDNHGLISRLSGYKKTLRHVSFQASNQPSPKLILMIVSQDNYLLPQITKKPFIPILLQTSTEAAISVDKLSSQYMICKPLRLKSIKDDLMVLIDFLSCLDRNCELLTSLLDNGRIGYSMKLNSVNSVLIENSTTSDLSLLCAELKNQSVGTKDPSLVDSDRRQHDGRHDNSSHNQRLRARLFLGFTFGIVSMTLIVIWRELTSVETKNSGAPEIIEKNSRSMGSRIRSTFISFSERPFESKYKSESSFVENVSDIWQKLDRWNEFLFLKLDYLAEEIANLGRFFTSEGYLLIQRAKFALLNLLTFVD